MGVYSKHVLPKLVDWACRESPIMRQREKIVPRARGRVLDLGVGSGLNFSYLDPGTVNKVWGVDPSLPLLARAALAAETSPVEVELVPGSAEDLPFEDRSFDSVVMTYTLCTIPGSDAALAEIARVLAPDGELLFCEHGLAPDPGVRRWQKLANPVWRRLGGGCHLNRDVVGLLETGGFEIENLETMYIPGWRPASYNYWGSAAAR